MKRISLTTVGYADLKTGKVYTRKSDRNRGIQRRLLKEEKEKEAQQAQEFSSAINKLINSGKFNIK